MREEIRDFFKFLVKLLSKLFLHIYYIFPINNTIFFMTNMGKSYSGNPKYIYEKMITDERFKRYNIIWCFKDIEKNKNEVKKSESNKVIFIKKNNYIKFFYYILTSKILIYNCGGFSYVPIRKKQFLVETWHGGGTFKKIGLSVKNKTYFSKLGIKMASKDIKLFISSSKKFSEQTIRESMGYKGKILNSGMPRNDILFLLNKEKVCEIKQKLNLSFDDKLILYAPTFKGTEHNARNLDERVETLNSNLIKDELKKRYGGNWKFFVRGHQYASNIENIDNDGDWTKYPDMQELLLIADVLITDYSSSMWDFAFMNKICLLYTPDINNFSENERGFYSPIDIWPGIQFTNNNQIKRLIENLNKKEYEKKIKQYLTDIGSYENGTASIKVINALYEEIKK